LTVVLGTFAMTCPRSWNPSISRPTSTDRFVSYFRHTPLMGSNAFATRLAVMVVPSASVGNLYLSVRRVYIFTVRRQRSKE
jgi:hypothetical protein